MPALRTASPSLRIQSARQGTPMVVPGVLQGLLPRGSRAAPRAERRASRAQSRRGAGSRRSLAPVVGLQRLWRDRPSGPRLRPHRREATRRLHDGAPRCDRGGPRCGDRQLRGGLCELPPSAYGFARVPGDDWTSVKRGASEVARASSTRFTPIVHFLPQGASAAAHSTSARSSSTTCVTRQPTSFASPTQRSASGDSATKSTSASYGV